MNKMFRSVMIGVVILVVFHIVLDKMNRTSNSQLVNHRIFHNIASLGEELSLEYRDDFELLQDYEMSYLLNELQFDRWDPTAIDKKEADHDLRIIITNDYYTEISLEEKYAIIYFKNEYQGYELPRRVTRFLNDYLQ